MPTALKDGVLASSLVDNFSGDDFVLPKEAINTLKQGATFVIDMRDGISRLPINQDKVKILFERSSSPAAIPSEPGEARAKQVTHLVDEGMSPEEALRITQPGSATEGSKSSGVKTASVIVQHRVNVPSSEPEKTGYQAEPSPRLKAEMDRIEQVAKNSPITWREAPFSRAKMLGGNIWSRLTGRGFTARGAAGQVSSDQGPANFGTASPEIGRKSTAESFAQSVDTNTIQQSSGQPNQTFSEKNQAPGQPIGLSGTKSDHLSGSQTGTEIKKGILGAVGGKIGGSVAGMSTKIKGTIDTVKTFAGALAGNPLDILKSAKWLWDNKEKIIKYGVGIGGGLLMAPLLALYGAIAPWLAALSPATLAGIGIGGAAGFIVGGPLGMVAGAGLGAAVAANWGAITAGVGNALASIAGIGGALGSALGGLGAALAAPATAIGGLTIAAVTFTSFFVAPQARNQIIFGSDNFQNTEIQVEKTATPSQVKNDTASEIEYTVKITNTADHDWDILIKDTDIKVYKTGTPITLVMPEPVTELPNKLTKENNDTNPLVVTFKKLPIKAGQYNDSQIINIIEVVATDPITKETKNFTAQAIVQIGDLIADIPYGYPFGGAVTSLDDQLVCVKPGNRAITDYDKLHCGVDSGLVYKPHCGEVSHSGTGGSTSCLLGGVDISGRGTVLSTTTGTVSYSNFDMRLGGVVYIDSVDQKSGATYRAAFLHLNQEDLHPLGPIMRGDKVGSIYDKSIPLTYETGFHLHYQVTRNGTNIFFADYNQSKNVGSVIGPCLDESGRTTNIRPTIPALDKPGDVSYALAPKVSQNVTCVK